MHELPPLADGVLDRAWFANWVAAGIRDLERYLGKHAAFDAYCRRRTRFSPADLG